MAAAPVRDRNSAVDVIREQHWLELGDYLGQKPATIRSTMKLWFTILAELGYDLVATGANHQSARPAPAPPAPPPPEPSYTDVYHAVEGALFDVTSRRNDGERISDQAEVRMITAAVMACITNAASGTQSDDTTYGSTAV